MTAEAIVMNKFGIALAADSVIASHTATSPKLFNSIEKLFRLTSNGKVAIMVYEATEFMNIPWETLIADYRARLGDGEFDSVAAHAADFIDYLGSIEVSADEEDAILLSALTAHYSNLADRLRDTLARQMRDDHSSVRSLRRWAESELELVCCDLEARTTLPGQADVDPVQFYRNHFRLIARARQQGFFSNFEVRHTHTIRKTLMKLAFLFLQKDLFSAFSTGLVFAGFGTKEYLPSALAYRVEAMLPGSFRLKLDLRRHVSAANQGMIIPFAQSDMVYRFLQGVDKEYDDYLSGLHQQLASDISSFLIGKHVDPEKQAAAQADADGILADKFSAIASAAQSYRLLNFAGPVIDAVKNLPKRELATLAEALVHLTSLRRKMSVDIETAGEPIDVVVVSKADGFIWIKRKSYYDQSLNTR
ncbi:MAG: hypothetical protein AAF441_18635 [Pseudomonadota bacterium]